MSDFRINLLSGNPWPSLSVGPYANTTLLQADFPAASNAGLRALVAGADYVSNGTSWVGPADAPVSTAQAAAIAAVVLPPLAELRYATFGDSTADCGTIRAGGNVTDQEIADTPLGTATTTFAQTTRNGLPLYYPAAKLVAIGGISGQNTTQMIAREGLGVATTRRSISDVVNKSPRLVVLRGGSINDISGFTASTPQSSIDTVFNQHMQIIDTLVSANVRVLDEGIFGYDGNGSLAAADLAFIRATIVSLNARYKAAISTRDSNRVRWLEPSLLTHDGTGAFISGYSLDGTHLAQYGLRKAAVAEAAIVSSWFGPSDLKSYAGLNLLNTSAASLALYPQASVSGSTPPTGFNSQAANTSRQNSTIIQRNGKRWWFMEGVPAGTSPSLTMNLPYGVDSANAYQIPIVAGGVYGHEFDMFVETIDGSPLPPGWSWSSRVNLINGSSGRVVYDYIPVATLSPAAGDSTIYQHVRFNPIQISDSSSTLTNSSSWYLQINLVNGGPTLRMGIASANIVRLA